MKTIQVVILPKEGTIRHGELMSCKHINNNRPYIAHGDSEVSLIDDYTRYELYFISNDNIQKDDWYYTHGLLSVFQAIQFPLSAKDAKKVLCTTDTSLSLPLIPQSFLKAYVDSNGIITKIQIEMNKYPVDMYGNEIIYVSKGIQDITAVHSDANCSNDKEYIASYHKERIKLRSDGTVIVQSVKSLNFNTMPLINPNTTRECWNCGTIYNYEEIENCPNCGMYKEDEEEPIVEDN